MKKLLFATALTTALLFYGLATFAVADGFPTVVETKYGEVGGLLVDNGIVAWKGIPFAKPPVDDLRWKRPEEPDKWDGIKEASEFCEMCVQYVEYPPSSGTYVPYGNEDCLYINVWRPDTEEKDLPVYFWIYGGGNSTGAASLPNYDGANIAENSNLVVVSINYRVGPLGWFTHPSLRKGKKGTAMSDSGNYGTLDIIMALKWVKENIKAFGGDPNNVTIAGESAGGTNVYSLLMSPLATGLFHKAVSQSGFPWTDSVTDGDASADRVIDELMAIDGMTREGMKDNQIADYLRSKTAKEILSVYTLMPGGGTMLDSYHPGAEFTHVFNDGTVIPASGTAALYGGQYNKVPIILGTNEEEQKLFLFGLVLPPYSLPPCYYQTMAEDQTDDSWDPVVDDLAPLLSYYQPGDVYAYRFLYGTYRHAGPGCSPDLTKFNAWMDLSPYGEEFPYWNFGLMFGACHFLDVPFFFGNFIFYGLEWAIFNNSNALGYESLSDTMMDYVAQFAYNGEPGEVDGVAWEPWSTLTGPRILFDANATTNLTTMSTP
jgi:para-nitrobenzyl esterase